MYNFETKNGIQFSPIELDEDFREKYNVSSSDFFCLTKDYEAIRNTLYRKGGMFSGTKNDNYFFILKYTIAKYTDEEIKEYKIKDRVDYLKSTWIIIDSFGNELVEFENKINYPNLIKDSVLYKYDNKIFSLLDNSLVCECGYSPKYINTDFKYITETKEGKCYIIDKKTAEVSVVD